MKLQTAPTEFLCHDCRMLHPIQTNGGTGYARTSDGETICYACADKRQRESLKDRSHPFTGYISPNGKAVTSWTGGHLMTITSSTPCRLPRRAFIHGSEYASIRATDCHGGQWYGRGSPGICITLRPTR